jgi:hypothetical protein
MKMNRHSSNSSVTSERLYNIILPQVDKDNNISESLISEAGGIVLIIKQYNDADNGDYIEVFWDGEVIGNITISNIANDFPFIVMEKDNVSKGKHIALYSVTDINGNTSQSDPTVISVVDDEPGNLYPPPVFPDAENGIINQQSIINNNGTHIIVKPYSSEALADLLRIYVHLYDSEGKPSWSTYLEVTVDSSNISTGIEVLISDSVLSTASTGTICSYYQVVTDDKVEGLSDKACARLGGSPPSTSLDVVISTNAPVYDPSSFNLHPCNRGVIKGAPGDTVNLNVSGNAIFFENGLNRITLTLNTDGREYFSITNDKSEAVILSFYNVLTPDKAQSKSLFFANYTKGKGKIDYIASSTGALADGVTPCTIYLHVANDSDKDNSDAITLVRVRVSGNAIIDGYYSNCADIKLNSDSTAEIGFLNSVPENVSAEISLPEASGTINYVELNFSDFDQNLQHSIYEDKK